MFDRKAITKMQAVIVTVMIVVALIVVAVAYMLSMPAQTPVPTEIKVGASICLTGSLADMGKYLLRGYTMVIDKINEEGGLYLKEYGRRIPIKLIWYDDKSDATTAGTNVERLITVDGVDVLLGSWGSSSLVSISTVANRYKVPLVCAGTAVLSYENKFHNYTFILWDHAVISKEEADWYYNTFGTSDKVKTWVNQESVNDVALKCFVNFLHDVKLAIFIEDTTLGMTSYKGIKQQVSEKQGVWANVTLVYEAIYKPGTTDFSSIISEAKVSGANMVFFSSSVTDGITIMRQMTELGFHPEVVHAQKCAEVGQFYESLGRIAEGTFTVATWHYSVKYPGSEYYVERYRALYGGNPDIPFGFAVSCAQVLFDAIERAGSLNKEKIRDALASTNFVSIVGPVEFPLGFGHFIPSLKIIQWQNGKQEIIYPSDVATAQPMFPKPW
jgi:branched-chain amino acid transport system substrate-binding protein